MSIVNTSSTPTNAQVMAGKYMLGALARQKSLVNLLTQDLDKSIQSKTRYQTDANASIVNITDLRRGWGSKIVFHNLHKNNAEPITGGTLEGREVDITSSDFSLKIGLTRMAVKGGDIMPRQTSQFDWDMIMRDNYQGEWFARLGEQRAIVQLAGGRGDFNASDIIIPKQSASNFGAVMINPVTAPTHGRTFYANDKKSCSELTAADTFSNKSLIQIRAEMDESSNPISGISLRGNLSNDKSMYLLLVTPKQWRDYKENTDTAAFELKQANALQRTKNWQMHDLFQGEMFYDEGILVMKYHFPIRYNTGSAINLGTNAKGGIESAQEASVPVDTAILLGGRALATAIGHANPHDSFKDNTMSQQGQGFHISTKGLNYGAQNAMAGTTVNGCAKIRFTNEDGYMQDHGVAVLLTATSGGQ